MLDRLRERGLLVGGGRQRTDATPRAGGGAGAQPVGAGHRDAAGRAGSAGRRGAGVAARVVPDQWYERYGQRARDWRLPKAEAARAALAVTVGADGFGLLEAVYATETPGWLRQVPAVQTLRPTWILQQYYRGEDGLRWRGKGELPPGALAIGSPTTPRPSARSMPMWANQTNASAMASPDPVTTPTTPMAAGGA